MSVIKVENLSKQYRLGQVGTGSLSHDINRLWHKARGKEDPYLKIGEENNRGTKGTSDYVWALRDLNFEIQKGDRVGIIGPNGAGKSTLLKILSRTTSPTNGSVKIKGKVSSLLEVGTGFHPELSGRDNIYLNGAFLGMSKRDINNRFDEIVDFAGVERYIDTPVKRYSTGMYLRLAFAVAAHLESDILIVDEVLAVGDAEFQKKCIGKMGEVSLGEGRTVLFVSHNMTAISYLCNRGLVLDKGYLEIDKSAKNAILYYTTNKEDKKSVEFIGDGIIKQAKIYNSNKTFNYDEYFKLEVNFKTSNPVKNLILGVNFKDDLDQTIIGVNNKHYLSDKIHYNDVTNGTVSMTIPKLKLLPGNYRVDLFFGDSTFDLEVIENAFYFNVSESPITKTSVSLDYRINKVFTQNVIWEYHQD